MNATPASPRSFLHTDGAYNQNVIAKTKLTDVDMTKLIENKVAFTNEQISTMNEKQLRYALNALMPSFVEQTKNNKAFAEVPLLIEKAQKTSDIKGMRDYVKMMQAQVATIDETSNALITNVDGYQLRDEGDGGRIEVETQIKQSRQETEEQAFFYQINEIGKQTDLSNAEKVKAIQQAFEALANKWDVLVPADVKFLTSEGFDSDGRAIYDWPVCLGFIKETIQEIARDNLTNLKYCRLGSKYGNNASTQRADGMLRSLDELGTPYKDNLSARHSFKINDTYFDAIDAIRKDSLDELNQVIKLNRQVPINQAIFKDIRSSYDYFIEDATSKLRKYGVTSDPVHGLKGEVAAWFGSDGELYLKGGAPQFAFPLSIDIMLRLGIISEYK